MKTPAAWYGSKDWLLKHLLPLPDHRLYVEVFGGAGTLLFAKEPAPIEVYNDVDQQLVNFFRVLRDEHRASYLVPLLVLTPYSRAEYKECRERLRTESPDFEKDSLEWARAFFVLMRQSFAGNVNAGWRRHHSHSRRGIAKGVSSWMAAIERLPEAAARLRTVQIENLDFRDCIRQYDRPGALHYLDPPYVGETRVSPTVYAHEMSAQDHEDLVALLLSLESAMVILSGYMHPIYEPLEKNGWCMKQIRRKNFTPKKCGRGRATRVECLWYSPNYGAWSR